MITIMPETEGNMLAVKASEKLTSEDYEDIFIPHLKHLIDKFGEVRVVLFLDKDFIGWELGAAWDDAVFGVQHRHDFEKIAVVGGQQWLEWATKIGAYFMEGQVTTYETTEFQDAVAWVKQ